ncbi:MAG: hypothetical protein H0V10_02400 [Geodermatophilaceae bacterium]|nr:hypothetical protein [Geodermatophilaceae bacterium]
MTEVPALADVGSVTSHLRAAAERRGWPVSDEDASLGAVLTEAPLRLTAEHRAAPVTRGRVQNWELVAFDVVYLMPNANHSRPLYAVTAVPVPIPLPVVRVAPRRFLTHGGAGLLLLTSGDEAFDSRWRVLASQDTPEVRALVGEQLRAVLLDGPDLDEMWTAAGHLAVSRVDGQHDGLIDEHSTLLSAAMAGLQRAV